MKATVAYNNNALRQVYFTVLKNNIKEKGYRWLLQKACIRAIQELIWIILLPFAILLHCCGVRRLLIRLEHIGHLAAEFDAHLKAQILDLLPKQHRFYFVLAPKKQITNTHLLQYWQKHFTIIRHSLLCTFLALLTRRYFAQYDVSHYISQFFGTQDIYRIQRLWGDRAPLLQLTVEDQEWGCAQLQALGINPQQWYVCLHVREGGYLPHNELIQSHRNASIENMKLAIEEIVKRGGVVVRMGDSSMRPLAWAGAGTGVIDYAHHPLKSARLDVYLCARAKFFLGCTSGLSFVSMVFGVPVASANMIPVAALGVAAHDLSIPKLLWSNKEKRYFHFAEILSQSMGDFYFTQQYHDADIKPVENSAEDILALTNEMLDRIENQCHVSDADQALHDAYLFLFKPGHYAYGAASRVCIAFLKRHHDLM